MVCRITALAIDAGYLYVMRNRLQATDAEEGHDTQGHPDARDTSPPTRPPWLERASGPTCRVMSSQPPSIMQARIYLGIDRATRIRRAEDFRSVPTHTPLELRDGV